MTRRRRNIVRGCVAFVALALGVAPDARADSVSVGTTAEAWYVVRPACPVTAVECMEPPDGAPSPYPAHTLHVAVTGGSETARTQLALDVSSLPDDVRITGGQLRLPVAGADAGSVQPETAALRACVVYGIVPSRGVASRPPEHSCGLAADATFEAPVEDRGPAFVVDLSRFAPVLREPGIGLAIIAAADELQAATTWHVAINGAARPGEGVDRLSASIEFTRAPMAAGGPSTPGSIRPARGASVARPSVVPPPPVLVAPAASGDVAARVAVMPASASSAGPASGFEQPAVFAVPIVVLVGGVYLSWALTRPIRTGEA